MHITHHYRQRCRRAGEMFRNHLPFDQTPATKTVRSISGGFFRSGYQPDRQRAAGRGTGQTAFGEIYTFGPTFRAENSNTARHLAEFWMIEPEMAFYDLEDNEPRRGIHQIHHLATRWRKPGRPGISQPATGGRGKAAPQDKRSELGLIEKLEFVLNNDFERLTYTEAIDILRGKQSQQEKEIPVPDYGLGNLQSEHERYLVENILKSRLSCQLPQRDQGFYMRQNEDGKTVAAMGYPGARYRGDRRGSQREERQERLEARMKKCIFRPKNSGGTSTPAVSGPFLRRFLGWALKEWFSL